MTRVHAAQVSRRRRHRRPVASRRLLGAMAGMLLLATCCSSGPRSPTTEAGAATNGSAARFTQYRSRTYADDRYWLCKPKGESTNHCLAASLDSTIVRADGSTEVVPHEPLAQGSAPVDCFFVYPTIPGIDFGPDRLNDRDPLSSLPNKIVVVGLQAARFTEICNVYAPLYRAMTVSGWSAPADKQKAALDLAYRDVRDSFRHYMANFNHGRRFVLIGHSQGSIHLERLIRDELDNDRHMRRRLISGLLIGGTVQTRPGRDVGGSFKHVPLCRSTTQTSCVIAYNSYAANPAPDPATYPVFGHDGRRTVAACTNPAALRGGTGELKPYLLSGTIGVPVTTPYVQVPHALRARCAHGNGMTYLAMSPTSAPGDQRDVEGAVTNIGFWGLHLMESNLTQGNLIGLVRRQIASVS
jgi:Protein of unknown function (DUF3089)